MGSLNLVLGARGLFALPGAPTPWRGRLVAAPACPTGLAGVALLRVA